MPSSSRLRLVGLGIFVIGSLFASACSHPVDDQGDDEAAATKNAFDPNNVLDDDAMTDYGAMSQADVQAFLEKKNP